MKKQLQVITLLLVLISACIGCRVNEVSDQKSMDKKIEIKSDKKIDQPVDANVQENDKTEIEAQIQTETDWINVYIDILYGSDFAYEEYALIFVNEDNIPELLGNNPDSYYQICGSFSDGTVTYYDKMPYGTFSREYYYLPERNSIASTCTGDNGRGQYEEYYILEREALEHNLTIGKIPQANEMGDNVWNYEKNGEKITEEEWKSLTKINDNYISFYDLKYYSKDEMISNLLNYFQ